MALSKKKVTNETRFQSSKLPHSHTVTSHFSLVSPPCVSKDGFITSCHGYLTSVRAIMKRCSHTNAPCIIKTVWHEGKKENETAARTHTKIIKSKHPHISLFSTPHANTHSPWPLTLIQLELDLWLTEWRWICFFFLVTVKVSMLQGSELDAPLFFSSGSPTLSLLSPLHRCFLFHLYFNLSPTPSPLAVVVCGLQGGCVSAGPLPVWAVRSGLRWVLPGQGPLLHLGRTCLQPLYADRAQVGRTYQLYADPDSIDNITADWVSPYGLNLFYYEKNQCGINLPKFDLNHICW